MMPRKYTREQRKRHEFLVNTLILMGWEPGFIEPGNRHFGFGVMRFSQEYDCFVACVTVNGKLWCGPKPASQVKMMRRWPTLTNLETICAHVTLAYSDGLNPFITAA